MVRVRRLAVGCALGSVGATVAVVLVARLDFAYHDPALHVALETTAAITASAAAFLLLGRFWRTGFLDELILSAGLSLLALSNFAFAALPAVFGLHSDRSSLWSMLFTGTFAALLICLAALLPRRRLGGHGATWPLAIYGGVMALAVLGTVLIAVYQDRLPRGVTSSLSAGGSHPHLNAQTPVFTLQLCLALLYLLAALGFARRSRLTGDELSVWLELACIFSAASRVNYAFHPSLYANWVYTGDVFRLGFYFALLIGAAREIASYWTSVIAAASLEERRRLARDVHDGLAQEIAFIARNARLLRGQGADPQLVERILRGVSRAQEESRRVIGALASKENEPLEQALAEAARDAARRYGAAIDMDLASGIALSPREKEAVVRIASEAVANAARHSGAETLRLYLERVDAGIRLEVVDDGEGFDDEEPRRGFGLVTMRDRAQALGGKLRVDSRRGSGTRVELEL